MAASIGLQDGLGTTFHTSFVCTVQASFRCTVNRRLTLDLRNLQDLSDFLTAFCLTMPLSQISKYLTCHTSPIYTDRGLVTALVDVIARVYRAPARRAAGRGMAALTVIAVVCQRCWGACMGWWRLGLNDLRFFRTSSPASMQQASAHSRDITVKVSTWTWTCMYMEVFSSIQYTVLSSTVLYVLSDCILTT